jgi:cullin 4
MPRNKAALSAAASGRGPSSGTGGGGRSRIVIKPFSKPPSLPPNYYESTTAELLDAQRFLNILPSSTSHQQVQTATTNLQSNYTSVVHLVSHHMGVRLYNDLRFSMQEAARLVLPDSSATLDMPYIVSQYHSSWISYLVLIRHVFLPLDRTHLWNPATQQAVRGSTRGLSVWGVGLQVFAERLQELKLDSKLYEQWKAGLLQEWNDQSSGKSPGSWNASIGMCDSQLLQQVWYMWGDLGWLSSLPLQEDLQSYWQKVAVDLKQRDVSPADFLQYCVEKHHKVSCWSTWLPSAWLWNILEQHLIAPHLQESILLPDALRPLLLQQLAGMDESSVADPPAPGSDPTSFTPVQQLWMLSGRLPKGQEQVASCLSLFAKTQGMQIVQQLSAIGAATATTSPTANTKGPPVSGVQVVSDLLQFQDRLGRLIASLPNHEGVIVLKSTWEQVLNFEYMAESFAKFLDQILRNAKKMDQYHNDFSKIIAGLFVPLTSKDVFEAFYKKDLAKRLLWNRIVSMDVEKAVVSLFKAECGAAYTSKMEGMFQDVDWSRETMMLYKQATAGDDSAMDVTTNPALEMEATVLTTGYWPMYPQHSFHLPTYLVNPRERFEGYYKNKYQGRRIVWQYALGHCVVKANGFSRPYEFIVSLSQALVLVQFNERGSWTLQDLMKQIGMEDREEMERILQSLSVAKEGTRILKKLDFDVSTQVKKKKPRSAVDDKDHFEVFEQFESNQRRIRINNIMVKESKEERDKTVEAVSRDRLYLIDAVLVRIMKARKTILHQNLIPQVLEQLKVPATAADVKKRIESLIEREYMERDVKDRNRYNYLA